MKHRGAVCVPFEKLARALNLKPGLRVIGVETSVVREEATFVVVGEGMPETRERHEAMRFSLAELMGLE